MARSPRADEPGRTAPSPSEPANPANPAGGTNERATLFPLHALETRPARTHIRRIGVLSGGTSRDMENDMKMVMAIALAAGTVLATVPGAALAQDRFLMDRGGGGGGGAGAARDGGGGGAARDFGGRGGGGGGGGARDFDGRGGDPRILRRGEPGGGMDRRDRDGDRIVRPVRPGERDGATRRDRDRDRELRQLRPGRVVIDRDRDHRRWKRWRPGLGWGVVVIPSYAYGAQLGWCHYHRYPAAGMRPHRDVRCHYHASWRHPSIAYVGAY